MKFGLWYAAVGPMAFPKPAVALARAAETAGFESLWTGDHVILPARYESVYPYSTNGRMAAEGPIPMAEPLVWAAHVSAATKAIKFGTGVLVLPQREPVLLAKQAASVATLSDDRLLLGVGAGWLAEEFAALGADFATRGRRVDEYIAAMRTLWAKDQADFEGAFTSFSGAQLCPRPPSGSVPIIVGGESPAAARRAGRLGDGFFPAKTSPEQLPGLRDLMARSAESSGRDADAIEISVNDNSLWDPAVALDAIATWAGLGVQRIIINPRTFDVGELAEQLDRFGSEVISHVHG